MSDFDEINERFNEIRETILEWLQDRTDRPVVFADQSDPRPNEPHVSFKLLTNLIKLGSFDERILNKTSPYKSTLRAHREFVVAIEAVGSPVGPSDDLDDFVRATDILTGVHLSLDQITVRDRFNAIGLAVVNEGAVTDISQLLETETEPRALLEVRFRARFDITDNPGYFEKVEMSGDVDTDSDGNSDYNTGTILVQN